MNITIECDSVNIDTRLHDNQIKLEIVNPYVEFIQDLELKDIVSNRDNLELLDAIVENDEDLLHSYLEANGYIFNKA